MVTPILNKKVSNLLIFRLKLVLVILKVVIFLYLIDILSFSRLEVMCQTLTTFLWETLWTEAFIA